MHSLSDSERRNIIIEEFIREFNADGPHVNLDNVSKKIHMSKKTIYKVFGSKTALYDYILEDAKHQILEGQEEVYLDRSLSTREKLRKILTIPTTREKEINIALLPGLKETDPDFYDRILDAYELQWTYFVRLVNEGKADGTVRPEVNADFLVGILSSSMQRFYVTDFLRKCGYSYSEAIQHLADVILDGIFTK